MENKKLKKMLLLFSHELTSRQIADAETNFHIGEFVSLPDNLQNIWSNIPADEENDKHFHAFESFIENSADEGDYILIQGEMGMVYHMVSWCLHHNYIPVYSATKRVYHSNKLDDNKIENIHTFEHQRFKYFVP